MKSIARNLGQVAKPLAIDTGHVGASMATNSIMRGIIPTTIKDVTSNLAKNFRRVGTNLTKIPFMKTTSKYEAKRVATELKFTKSTKFKKLDDIGLTPDTAAHIVSQDANLSRALQIIEKKAASSGGKLSGITTSIAAVGFGTAIGGIWSLLEQYKNELSACHRYEINSDGSITSCKVLELSCGHASIPKSNTKICLRSQLTPYQLQGTCPSDDGILGFRCDSNQTNPNDINYIKDRDLLPSNVYFRCINATYADAFADLTADAAKIVKSAATSTFSIFKYVVYIIIVVVMIGAITGALFVFKRMKQLATNENEEHNFNDEDKISHKKKVSE